MNKLTILDRGYYTCTVLFRNITVYNIHALFRNITVYNLTISDGGDYTCTATSINVQKPSKQSIHIKVKQKCIFLTPPLPRKENNFSK